MGTVDPESRPARCAVGIGASAGGIEALTRLVGGLPEDLEAAVLIVLHVSPSSPSVLDQILGRQTRLPVVQAQDGAPLVGGQVMVATPDRHLLVADGHVRLVRGPKENGVRPAVDPMLRSLAAAYGPRATAVVLSGSLGDGSGGARVVAAAGGRVIVQEPEDALVPSMPQRALQAVGERAEIMSAAAIGRELGRITTERAGEEDTEMGRIDTTLEESRHRPEGPATGLTCPECNGALWTVPEGKVGHRYRCRIGHAYSEDALVGAQGSRVEAALWSALEALEERAELLERIAARHGDARPRITARLRRSIEDTRGRAELLRSALAAGELRPDTLDLDGEDLVA